MHKKQEKKECKHCAFNLITREGENDMEKKEKNGKKNLRVLFLSALIISFIAGAVPTQALQTPLPGSAIPQFVDPLPLLDVSGGTIKTVIAGPNEIELRMREFQANMMPSTFIPASGTYTGTWVFGYIVGPNPPAAALDTYTGPVIIATRGVPTQIRYVNNLGDTNSTNVPLWKSTEDGAIDQTLHWADPLNGGMNMCAHMVIPGVPPSMGCDLHYSGPIPAVVHLHGGEVPPVIDGSPEAWFTSDGAFHGASYYTRPGVTAAGNESVYRYPNSQDAAPIWFHDHLLGGTRINVYCGLAGAYVLTDPKLKLPTGLNAIGLQQGTNSATLQPLIPLVIQDRMFDVNGQLFFPNQGINPEHPYWIPEFVGDTICVNGKVWPYLNVQAKRYRFLIINGSNARTYELFTANETSAQPEPTIWQIATDGGYLDRPVPLSRLLIQPGERADIIIDFKGLGGQNLLLRNDGITPYPYGNSVTVGTTDSVMEFRVQPGAVIDKSYNPAGFSISLPAIGLLQLPGPNLRPPMVRLVNPLKGTLATGVKVQQTRQLTLNEVQGPGGPREILVNNTKWDGKRADGNVPPGFVPVTIGGITNYYSELPKEGTTEVWELVNLTMDAHPIHTHLTQFQLINRQHFDPNILTGYPAAYAAAFPGGVYIPAFGPPLDYFTGILRALGGNPDVVPFLQGVPFLPLPNEAGWKDTIMARPGMVTRIAVRYAPQNKPIASSSLNYVFDPNALGFGYVWHCHIVDHEDNEMMRPYKVVPKNVMRTYVQGVDY